MKTPAAGRVSLRFWGVRGSVPAPGAETSGYGGNTSCLEVRAGHEIVILDSGTGIRALGAKLQADSAGAALEATLLISHTHWDHIQGLPFFAPAYGARNRFRIIAPPGKRKQIQQALDTQMAPIHFPIRFRDLPGVTGLEELPEGGIMLGPLFVKTTELNHPGGCAGFRLEADSIVVCYLPDHEPYHSVTAGSKASRDKQSAQANLASFVRGCDLLILDTQYDEREYPARVGWGHGCIDDSVALALEAGARELICFHHDPSHSDGKINQMITRGRQIVERAGERLVVRAAREGNELHPPPRADTARNLVPPLRSSSGWPQQRLPRGNRHAAD